jgi:hypothetical protein
MKFLLLTICLLFNSIAFSQLKKYEREVDSLSALYKKNVIGYSKTITLNIEPRESLIIFYVENGETEEMIVWTKIIDSDVKILLLNNLEVIKEEPFVFTHLVYYNNSLIGDITGGYFIKIKKSQYVQFAVNKDAQLLLSNNEDLDRWLRIKFLSPRARKYDPSKRGSQQTIIIIYGRITISVA